MEQAQQVLAIPRHQFQDPKLHHQIDMAVTQPALTIQQHLHQDQLQHHQADMEPVHLVVVATHLQV